MSLPDLPRTLLLHHHLLQRSISQIFKSRLLDLPLRVLLRDIFKDLLRNQLGYFLSSKDITLPAS